MKIWQRLKRVGYHIIWNGELVQILSHSFWETYLKYSIQVELFLRCYSLLIFPDWKEKAKDINFRQGKVKGETDLHPKIRPVINSINLVIRSIYRYISCEERNLSPQIDKKMRQKKK